MYNIKLDYKKFYTISKKTSPIIIGKIFEGDLIKVILPNELFGKNNILEVYRTTDIKSAIENRIARIDIRERDIVNGVLYTNITKSPFNNGSTIWSDIMVQYTYNDCIYKPQFHHVELVRSYILASNTHHEIKMYIKSGNHTDDEYDSYIKAGLRKQRLREECIKELTKHKFRFIHTMITTGDIK